FGKALSECREQAGVWLCRARMEKSDHRHLRLLRTRRQRPTGSRAAEQRDELAPPHHSITSSAPTRRPGGTVRPSAFAVLRLTTNSNFTACCTGKSAGFPPLRIRPA